MKQKWSRCRGMMYFALLVVVAAVVTSAFFGYAIVVQTQEAPPHEYAYQKGQRVNPLRDLSIDGENCTAYLVLTSDDRTRLPSGVVNATVLKSDDPSLIRRMRDNVEFVFNDADVATVTSRFLIVRDGKLVFEAGVVIEESSEGFQSREFGWLEVSRLGSFAEILREFKRVWVPVVWL